MMVLIFVEWRNSRFGKQAKGFNAYEGVYSDSQRWFSEGWVDYLAPQLYWPIEAQGQSYSTLLQWWTEQNVFPCRWNMAGAPSKFARKAMSGELYEEENQRCEQVMAKALGR